MRLGEIGKNAPSSATWPEDTVPMTSRTGLALNSLVTTYSLVTAYSLVTTYMLLDNQPFTGGPGSVLPEVHTVWKRAPQNSTKLNVQLQREQHENPSSLASLATQIRDNTFSGIWTALFHLAANFLSLLPETHPANAIAIHEESFSIWHHLKSMAKRECVSELTFVRTSIRLQLPIECNAIEQERLKGLAELQLCREDSSVTEVHRIIHMGNFGRLRDSLASLIPIFAAVHDGTVHKVIIIIFLSNRLPAVFAQKGALTLISKLVHLFHIRLRQDIILRVNILIHLLREILIHLRVLRLLALVILLRHILIGFASELLLSLHLNSIHCPRIAQSQAHGKGDDTGHFTSHCE
jgi:hypothetical protein